MAKERPLSRGQFMKLLGIAGGATVISACEKVFYPNPSQQLSESTSEPGLPSTATPTEVMETVSTTEPIVTASPTETSTVTPTSTEAQTATPTETNIPAENIWKLSPDGHIYYNESELYEGLFTINSEHPEYLEKYWEDSVRGLWNVNKIGQNANFVSQFPTADTLVNYIKEGRGLISNLWIPVIYPKSATQFQRAATLMQVAQPIDLSTIALSIQKPTVEEIYKFSGSYPATEYLCYIGAKGEVLINVISMNDKNILSFNFKKDLLMDTSVTWQPTGEDRTFLAFSEKKSGEDNLKTALQLIRSWNATVLNMEDEFFDGSKTFRPDLDPPMIQIHLFVPLPKEWIKLDTLDEAPLILR